MWFYHVTQNSLQSTTYKLCLCITDPQVTEAMECKTSLQTIVLNLNQK